MARTRRTAVGYLSPSWELADIGTVTRKVTKTGTTGNRPVVTFESIEIAKRTVAPSDSVGRKRG